MNYKIAIDPGNGGSDSGYIGNGITEKDYNLLISNYMKERFDSLGVPTIVTRNTDRNLSDDERKNIIESSYGNDKNVIVISNNLNKGGSTGAEIVYSLKDNPTLAASVLRNMRSSSLEADRYYQLRDSSDTSKDYYPIIRNLPNYKVLNILYGYVDNAENASALNNKYKDYAEAVVKAVADYINVKYIPAGDNYYVVVKGDSLYKIATKYGISVEELKKANNLSSNLLNIGQTLYIPKKENSNDSDTSSYYTVQKGDTLYSIATKNKISVNDIKNANNLTSNLLSIGQKLIIPLTNVYIVQKGDTLYSIALKNNITVDEIKRKNNLTSNLLSIGQKLSI